MHIIEAEFKMIENKTDLKWMTRKFAWEAVPQQ
jgi:hypothetical protein